MSALLDSLTGTELQCSAGQCTVDTAHHHSRLLPTSSSPKTLAVWFGASTTSGPSQLLGQVWVGAAVHFSPLELCSVITCFVA